MIDAREIAKGIYRVSMWNEEDLIKAGILWPDATYNMFVIKADRSAIIQTLFRRSFKRVRARVAEIIDLANLSYIVVPHHEGDSSGAINDWLMAAPRATILCSELCAALNLRDFADREPRVVKDGDVVDLGSHRLRFFMTPQVNQWDSLMAYEEATKTLFPNDLFSGLGTEAVTDGDHVEAALGACRHLGYQPNDRVSLDQCLEKIGPLDVDLVASMHGPAVRGRQNYARLVKAFRESSLSG